MEIEQIINNDINQKNEKSQEKFLDTTLGKAIDNGVNIGIRYLFPNYVEEEVINLKDNLLEYGLKDGIKKSIESAINVGKSVVGIVTGNFEDISQMQTAVKNGGIIDSVSELLDDVIDKMEESKKMDKGVIKLIKNGKDTILDSVENNIESTLNNQVESAQKLEKYMDTWKEYYSKQDIEGMEKEYNKMQKAMKDLMPIEKTINNAKSIETIHNLIKNNGNNFALSEEEKNLVENLNL